MNMPDFDYIKYTTGFIRGRGDRLFFCARDEPECAEDAAFVLEGVGGRTRRVLLQTFAKRA
jgi:hypothetical protein